MDLKTKVLIAAKTSLCLQRKWGDQKSNEKIEKRKHTS